MTREPLPEPAVFADERQSRIAELVAVHGRVRLADLVALFGVTEPTIRKDLSALQQSGLVKRTHGGAIAVRSMLERELDVRAEANVGAKEAIARACLAEIKDGDAIFLDSGSTVQRIAAKLAGRNITVLTNAIAVAQLVADLPGVEHVLVGGRLRRVAGALIGALATENLERFTANLAFIGVSGFSENGLTVADLEEAQLKATVIERAHRVVLPLDHSKVGVTHFARVCELDAVDVLVTDQASAAMEELCAAHGIRLVVAQLV